ncbi:glycosyltransferase [Reyranella sp.]|uniref:glycosyltransferase n=1 Tax=Reyranella sp. TaxID=1929291 RepID=UPI003D11E888
MPDIQHIIVTRIGLGLRRPTPLRRSLIQLKHTLLPSIRAQSNRRFRWVLSTDSNTPAWFQDELRSLVGGLGRVAPHDPFSIGLTPPIPALCQEEFGTSEHILMTRVDHDDALHGAFVQKFQDELVEPSDRPVIIRAPLGIQVMPRAASVRFASPKRGDTSVGASVYVPRLDQRHVYNTNHNQLESKFSAAVRKIKSDEPLWAYFRSSTQDSQAGRRRGVRGEAVPDRSKWDTLALFGLMPQHFTDMAQELAELKDEPIVRMPSDLSILALKAQLMEIHSGYQRRHKKTLTEKAKRKLDFKMAVIRQAVYAVTT